jgi:hypothetical protein
VEILLAFVVHQVVIGRTVVMRVKCSQWVEVCNDGLVVWCLDHPMLLARLLIKVTIVELQLMVEHG